MEKQITKEEINEVARLVQDSIYNYGKAKIFNVLEASMDGKKLEASKQMVKDILDKIGRESCATIRHIVSDEEVRSCETCGNRMPLSVLSVTNPETRCNRKCDKYSGFQLWEPSASIY